VIVYNATPENLYRLLVIMGVLRPTEEDRRTFILGHNEEAERRWARLPERPETVTP
jgi:hypothetical protein